MKARIENGFWVFRAPVGYRYINAPSGGGKVLIPYEEIAPILSEALEGYASGHFASQAELQRFLESKPQYPKDKKDGTLRPMTVNRLLKKPVYAGYVEAPNWDVSLRKGQHEGLISFETFKKIQDVLEGKKRRYPARKDHNEDFPLRGFIHCDCCGNAMTAAWSKGKTKYYAYYRCETRGCEAKSKSVPRAKMESGFAEIMKALEPAEGFFELAKAMMRDAWDKRFVIANGEKTALKKQIDDLNGQIESLLDRIVEANNSAVISAYEDKIDKLERSKMLIQEKIEDAVPEKGCLEDCMELAMRFLSSPWNIYKKVTTRCVKPCFGWPLLSLFNAAQTGCMEHQNFRFLSGG